MKPVLMKPRMNRRHFVATAAAAFSTVARAAWAPAELPFTLVLGIAQDAGFPQAGCQKDCCKAAWKDPALRRFATSLAIVDPVTRQTWMLDCSPDFKFQLRDLQQSLQPPVTAPLDGILLTHAHIGHYSGLVHLGREVIGAKAIKLYCMPRMAKFLGSNGPWDQLVKLKNVELQPLADGATIALNERISVTPFAVPHRDEYSETVGFRVSGPTKSVVYLPDIDKWSKWTTSIEDMIADCDAAYLDGTFFGNGEIPGRDMSQIPHPFISESLQRFSKLPAEQRQRIKFIHLNHTNPALRKDSAERRLIAETGMQVAEQGERLSL